MRSKWMWIGCLASLATVVQGQQSILPTERQSTLWTHGCFQMWRVQYAHYAISQVSFPLALYIPLHDQINLNVSTIPAISAWGSAYKLNGLSDTWVQGTYMGRNEKWMANLGMGIPTGKTRLTNDEMTFTTEILSQNMFNFRVPIYGGGFCVKAGGGLAYPIMEKLVLGVGGQYVVHTPYHPVRYSYTYRSQYGIAERTADLKYKPGNEIALQLGFDWKAGETTKTMFDVQYSVYGKDRLEGESIYGSGPKVAVNAGFFHQYDEQFVWVHLTYRVKGKHELLNGLEFVAAEKNLNGDQIELGVVWKALPFRNGEFFVFGDGRFYARNQYQKAGASIYGGGFGLNFILSPTVTLNANVRYFGGTLKDADLKRNTEGMEILCGFKTVL
ncbi:MAG TPA: hypothetical protein VGB38_02395 [bacterium]